MANGLTVAEVIAVSRIACPTTMPSTAPRRAPSAIRAAAALGAGRFLASLLFEVESTDPFVFAAAALLVASVALLSATIPALRASQTDPRNVLYEA